MPVQGVQQRGLVAPSGYPVSPAGANMCMPVAQLQRQPALAVPTMAAAAMPSQPVAHTSPPARKSTLDSSLGDELTPIKEADPATAPRKPNLTLPDNALKEPEPSEGVKESLANSAGGRTPVYIRSDLHKEFAEAKLPKKFFKHISKLQGGVVAPRRKEFGSRDSILFPRVWQKRASTEVENIWSDSESDSDEGIPMGHKRSMSQPTLLVR